VDLAVGLVMALDLQDTFHGLRYAPHDPGARRMLTRDFQLFKHHQSVLTGHLKMMDMVRKHCVEGTGNYATAQACVDRTHEMLRSFKKTTASFVCANAPNYQIS